MKKIIGILIVTLLIATALPAFGITENQNTTNVILDELDQQSTKSDKAYAIGPSDRELAQSFTPTLPVLTKVILRLKSTGTPEFYYYYVDIKSSYLGSALTTAYIHRDTLVIGTNICEFDFPDISVTPGTKYYIILRGVSDSSDLSKVWWWYGYPDPYASGDAWYESISGWNYLQEGIVRCDFCFETYGTAENNPPYAPSVPDGPTSGVIDVEYSYYGVAIDPDMDWLAYRFDFGNTMTGWTSYTGSGIGNTETNIWSVPGTYQVKVQAKDIPGAISSWSVPLTVVISSGESQPPNKPSTPSGPTSGNPNTEYTYSSSTTDPDGDKIQYLFDWGDGQTSAWTDPVNSGQPGSALHKWTTKGTYQIKVKARDIPSFEESEWSDPLSVSMPKNKPYINTPFLNFLENYPHLFTLLRQLLEL